MASETNYLKDITEIRSIMERSSRFLSLSGLAGVSAGIIAMTGVIIGWLYLDPDLSSVYYDELFKGDPATTWFVFTDAVLILLLSISAAIYFTTRKAKKQGTPIWDRTAIRLILNLFLPLAAGGFFCLALFYNGSVQLILPSTLIFYGLALLNASKYTLNDIRYLGICEIVLGILSAFFLPYGLLAWATGFGLLHIVYGIAMYLKYDVQK